MSASISILPGALANALKRRGRDRACATDNTQNCGRAKNRATATLDLVL
jgi:hypothetical protein